MPARTPANSALRNRTFVFGIRMYTPVKNSHIRAAEVRSSMVEIAGDMILSGRAFCSVDDMNIVRPLLHIIRTGRIRNIAV